MSKFVDFFTKPFKGNESTEQGNENANVEAAPAAITVVTEGKKAVKKSDSKQAIVQRKAAQQKRETAAKEAVAGLFKVTKLSEKEAGSLKQILQKYATDPTAIDSDFDSLSSITSEVKSISNQAAILHGERIKKAQQILKRYRDGAFTAWLIATYGNRQTPYNFLQYYEFHTTLPQTLHPLVEAMPRQAVYTLASRSAPKDAKELFVQEYKGQTKQELMLEIRKKFPLSDTDGRRSDASAVLIGSLAKAKSTLLEQKPSLQNKHREEILIHLSEMMSLLKEQA